MIQQEEQKTHQQQKQLQAGSDPMTKFMYALKAKESKRPMEYDGF